MVMIARPKSRPIRKKREVVFQEEE